MAKRLNCLQTSCCDCRWRRFTRMWRGCRLVIILWTFWPWTSKRTTTCTSSPFTGSLASLTSTLLMGMFNSFHSKCISEKCLMVEMTLMVQFSVIVPEAGIDLNVLVLRQLPVPHWAGSSARSSHPNGALHHQLLRAVRCWPRQVHRSRGVGQLLWNQRAWVFDHICVMFS